MSIDPDENEIEVLVGSDVEFRSETIYFLVLDRFAIGNAGKHRVDDPMFDPRHEDWLKYWGGDLQGVVDKVDYLRGFGVSAIWTTPLFEQVDTMTVEDTPRAPMHGYWTSDFKRINARWANDPSESRLFARDDTIFDELLSVLHQRGMKFILDIVCNHSSPQTSQGKGKLYDDGELVADFDNDTDHWYHHYGETVNWDDQWQVQNCELCGLATFNENNIKYRNYIKDAIKLWIGKGVDALRIDTVKHMPLWFWQEFTADVRCANPDLFRFGEWIYSHPENPASVEFANKAGMSILDFGFCQAVREILGDRHPDGFHRLKAILDLDGNYSCATELVTFFENHDMSRLQSMGASDETIDLALVILITSRGIPCVYYGCEQYLHNDTDGGNDPYNRPMMKKWEPTRATKLIRALAAERKANTAVQWGGQWPVFIDAESYVYLRRYRDSRCLVFINRGPARDLELENVDFKSGSHRCLIGETTMDVQQGRLSVHLPENGALVFATRGKSVKAKAIIRIQVNRAPTKPGDRMLVIGDCEELGRWDLSKGYELECVNSNTWFGELPFDANAGKTIGYKYVILSPVENSAPYRENRAVRRRLVPSEGTGKWRDGWEE